MGNTSMTTHRGRSDSALPPRRGPLSDRQSPPGPSDVLPWPEEEFLGKSVRLPSGGWEERFHALCAQPGVRRFFQPEHLGQDSAGLDVHARNNLWIIDTARALAPAPERILALMVWDEQC
ncbi:MAG: hypothetical protein ACRD5H_06270 [Nitrososphaerales archaeon]